MLSHVTEMKKLDTFQIKIKLETKHFFLSLLYQPLLEKGQIFSQVVPLQLVLVPLFADCFHLAPQLPQFLLEEIGSPVGLALLLLALELVQLQLQSSVLLLQVSDLFNEAGKAVIQLLQLCFLVAASGEELLVDGLSQGEVHLVI